MITANASNFRKNLYNTLEQVAKYNQVATINTKDGDVVLISADDYKNLSLEGTIERPLVSYPKIFVRPRMLFREE